MNFLGNEKIDKLENSEKINIKKRISKSKTISQMFHENSSQMKLVSIGNEKKIIRYKTKIDKIEKTIGSKLSNAQEVSIKIFLQNLIHKELINTLQSKDDNTNSLSSQNYPTLQHIINDSQKINELAEININKDLESIFHDNFKAKSSFKSNSFKDFESNNKNGKDNLVNDNNNNKEYLSFLKFVDLNKEVKPRASSKPKLSVFKAELINQQKQNLSKDIINYCDLEKFNNVFGSVGSNNFKSSIDEVKQIDQKDLLERKRKLKQDILKVQDSIEDEEELNLINSKLSERYIIHPDSTFKIIWDYIIVLITFYSLIFCPLSLAFIELNNFFTNIIELICSFFFIIDIILNFFTAYYDKDDELVAKKKKISTKYVKSWFPLDLISAIPTNYSYYFGKGNLGPFQFVNNFSKFNRIMKLVRVFKLMKFIEDTENNLNKIKLIDELNLSNGLKRFIQFLITFLIISHLLTCIWIFLATLDDHNWISSSNLTELKSYEIYIASLYFNLSTIFTIGYGDILSVSIYERIFNNIIMMVGVLLFSFTLSSLGNIITTYDKITKNYLNRLDILDEIRICHPNLDEPTPKAKNITFEGEEGTQILSHSESLYEKLFKFINYDYKNNKKEKLKLVKELPLTMKNEVIYEMYKNIINNFTFFHYSYQNGKNQAFNTRIVLTMRPLKIFKNEFFIHEGERFEEMIFVKNGNLSLEIDYNSRKIPIISLRKNDYYGVVQLLNNEISAEDIKVKSKVAEIYVINKKDLYEISIDHPEIFKEIFKYSSLNYLHIKELIENKKNIRNTEKNLKNKSLLPKIDKDSNNTVKISQVKAKINNIKFKNTIVNNKTDLSQTINNLKKNNDKNFPCEELEIEKKLEGLPDINNKSNPSYDHTIPLNILAKNSNITNTDIGRKSAFNKKINDEMEINQLDMILNTDKIASVNEGKLNTDHENINKKLEIKNLKFENNDSKIHQKFSKIFSLKIDRFNNDVESSPIQEQCISISQNENEMFNIKRDYENIYKKLKIKKKVVNNYVKNENRRILVNQNNIIKLRNKNHIKSNLKNIKLKVRENLNDFRNQKKFITTNFKNILFQYILNEKQPLKEQLVKLDNFYSKLVELILNKKEISFRT